MKENELKQLLQSHGATDVGFSDISSAPCDMYPQYKYAVTIVRKLADAVVETINGRPTISYFQHYRMTNTKLDLLALDAIDFIESEGYSALPVAASQSTSDNKEAYRGIFPHKTGAVLSGLGYIGKNGLLITEKYGSAIRMATVLTDMPLEPQHPIIKSGCGDCHICRDVCPAHAITGNEYMPGAPRDTILDAEKCSAHMKTYKDIGRGAVCGICIRACPKNK